MKGSAKGHAPWPALAAHLHAPCLLLACPCVCSMPTLPSPSCMRTCPAQCIPALPWVAQLPCMHMASPQNCAPTQASSRQYCHPPCWPTLTLRPERLPRPSYGGGEQEHGPHLEDWSPQIQLLQQPAARTPLPHTLRALRGPARPPAAAAAPLPIQTPAQVSRACAGLQHSLRASLRGLSQQGHCLD